MAEVLAKKDEIIHAESLALGASAETLADAGATIPQNTGDIVVICPSGDSLHMAPSVTPTSSLGQKITLGHPGRIPHAHQKLMQLISDDGSMLPVFLSIIVVAADRIWPTLKRSPSNAGTE